VAIDVGETCADTTQSESGDDTGQISSGIPRMVRRWSIIYELADLPSFLQVYLRQRRATHQ
jgi:hypothetical protein